MSDFILFFKAIILGIIQGVTEFLPVSSTGHMIIVGKLFEFEGSFAQTFEVFIQLGATCALLWYFKKDLSERLSNFFKCFRTKSGSSITLTKNKDVKFFIYLFIAFLPAAIVGLLLHKKIEILLGSALAVGVAQILGACLILFAEHKSVQYSVKTKQLDSISWKQSLSVGLWQILSLWPGLSRSGSTIMGGMLSKIDRPTATQFSFYLSIPVSFCSSFFMLAKHHDNFNSIQNILLLTVGFLFAFIVGLAVVRFIMLFVQTHSFRIFAYYRFILGGLILVLVYRNII